MREEIFDFDYHAIVKDADILIDIEESSESDSQVFDDSETEEETERTI